MNEAIPKAQLEDNFETHHHQVWAPPRRQCRKFNGFAYQVAGTQRIFNSSPPEGDKRISAGSPTIRTTAQPRPKQKDVLLPVFAIRCLNFKQGEKSCDISPKTLTPGTPNPNHFEKAVLERNFGANLFPQDCGHPIFPTTFDDFSNSVKKKSRGNPPTTSKNNPQTNLKLPVLSPIDCVNFDPLAKSGWEKLPRPRRR